MSPTVTSRRIVVSLIAMLLLSCFGCEPPKTPAPVAEKPNAVVAEAPKFAPPPQQAATAAPAPKPSADAPPAPGMVRDQASSAQTAKGKYEVNLFTQPASAYFAIKDQVVFNVQIPKAMQIFEATRNRRPSSHDEFMDQIVARNNIKLPELMFNHRYVYDAKRGELMVERPE